MHPLIENHRAEIVALSDTASATCGWMGLALGALLMDVQGLLDRPVEVVTEGSLHPEIRDRVLKEAQTL